MPDTNSAESPLEAAAGATGTHATETFALLGNETRLAILLALWEAKDPGTGDHAVSFSELYEQVDYDDPGNFNYHLKQLEGPFVRKRDDDSGYELRQSGLKLVQTIIAGAGAHDLRLEPTEIDRDCWRCGAPTAVTYRDGALHQVCTECEGVTTESGTPEGFLNGMQLDPAGLTDRCPEELLAAAAVAAYRHIRTMLEGLCSACSGPVDASLDLCTEHESDGVCPHCGRIHAIWAAFQCRVCKDYHTTTPTTLALFHPAVVAFYHDHGVSLEWHADDFESIERVLELITNHHEMALVSEEPPRVRVTVVYGGDELALTYDETVSVVDVAW